MLEIALYFATFIKESVANLRSGISKNSLMLCTEFFKSSIQLQNEEERKSLVRIIETVGPAIIVKTAYEKAFIAKEAKTAMTNILKTCVFPETLRVLLTCQTNN